MKRARASWYLVVSAECSEVIPILDDGSGPREYWQDVIYVFARNAKRARVLALRWFRRMYGGKSGRGYLEDGNPFRGMEVHRFSEEERRQYQQEEEP